MKIVGVDYYDRDTIGDWLVAENVPKHIGEKMIKFLNEDSPDTHFILVEDSYKLYVPEY